MADSKFLPELVLSYASVMGMIEDVGIKGDEYQWLSGVFYFGDKISIVTSTTMLMVFRLLGMGISHESIHAEATTC